MGFIALHGGLCGCSGTYLSHHTSSCAAPCASSTSPNEPSSEPSRDDRSLSQSPPPVPLPPLPVSVPAIDQLGTPMPSPGVPLLSIVDLPPPPAGSAAAGSALPHCDCDGVATGAAGAANGFAGGLPFATAAAATAPTTGGDSAAAVPGRTSTSAAAAALLRASELLLVATAAPLLPGASNGAADAGAGGWRIDRPEPCS